MTETVKSVKLKDLATGNVLVPYTGITVPTKTSDLTNDSGFITSHQTIKQDGITGATSNRYATCTVGASTAAKTASITSGTFNLEAGASVKVKFSNANTANNPTLNINGKGAKNIFHNGAQITTGANKALLAGTVEFVYDGTQWQLVGNYIDTGVSSIAWDNVTGKPETFTPSSHNHTKSEITDFPTIPTITDTYDGTSSNGMSGKAVKSALDTAIASVYKPAGSIAFANRPTPGSSYKGNVYNITDSFTTDSTFVEGAGNTYPAGTNIVCINTTGSTYKWDVLSGFVDLSGYQQKDTAVTHTASTKVGDTDKPVYIAADGTATAISYTIKKSVPADAVFTDHTYDVFTGANGTAAGTAGLVKAPGATDNTKFLKGDGTWAVPTDTDTTNTAGSGDTSSKIYLVGATSQTNSAVTYSHDTAFVDTNGRLNSAAPASDANDTTVATTKWVKDQGYKTTDNDTKNTTGGDDTSSKIFLVGMPTQTSSNGSSRTYTQDTAFVDANGRLNSAAPAVSANDTTVATTKWVKDQGYVTSALQAGDDVSNLVNDAGYLTAVGWDDIQNVPDDFTPSSHTHTKSEITDFPTVPTTTSSVTSGSAAALTSGGAYSNLVRRLSSSAATGSTTKGVYVDANGQVQACSYTVAKSVPADAVFTDHTYSTFVKSGTGAAGGLVPAPSTTAGTSKYLCEDGTWATPPDTKYTHPTTSGYKHIPSGGSSGQILKYSADGTATWANEYSYTHPTTSGNKHIPSGGSSGQFLKWSADGTATWAADNDTKNTAGGDDTSSKIFLVGMTAQTSSNGTNRTYSQDTAFVDTSGILNSANPATTLDMDTAGNLTKVATLSTVKSMIDTLITQLDAATAAVDL